METKLKFIAICITFLLVLVLGYVSIYYLGDYGWTVFVFSPLLIGFLPVFIVGNKIQITKTKAYGIAFTTLLLCCLSLLVFAIEGLICVVMASPLLILMVWIGAYLGYKSSDSGHLNPTNTTILLILISIGFLSFDTINKPDKLIPVTTTIIINKPIDVVWNNVVTFDTIHKPTHWLFKTGIAYPTNATIDGVGVGAVRHCNFSTGSFVEPITLWDEPNLLKFDVESQPIPMNEYNPFWEVKPPHIEGYFKSYKGEFRLIKLSEEVTQLQGTTWYKVDIYPVFYWKAWSDFIIHKIHKRVLNHIKEISENNL